MVRTTLVTLIVVGLASAGLSRVVLAGVRFEGETATFEFPCDDSDLAQLDDHPKIETIIFGGREILATPLPSPPYDVTDAGFRTLAEAGIQCTDRKR